MKKTTTKRPIKKLVIISEQKELEDILNDILRKIIREELSKWKNPDQ